MKRSRRVLFPAYLEIFWFQFKVKKKSFRVQRQKWKIKDFRWILYQIQWFLTRICSFQPFLGSQTIKYFFWDFFSYRKNQRNHLNFRVRQVMMISEWAKIFSAIFLLIFLTEIVRYCADAHPNPPFFMYFDDFWGKPDICKKFMEVWTSVIRNHMILLKFLLENIFPHSDIIITCRTQKSRWFRWF